MANLIKSIKVNGTSYVIDYDSLANRPVYKDITMGDFLLEETQLELVTETILDPSGKTGGSVSPFATAAIDIQAEVEEGDTFITTINGDKHEWSAQKIEQEDYTLYRIGDDLGIIFVQWRKASDGTWEEGYMSVPSPMAGTYTVSIQRYTKDIKTLDREFFGLFNLAGALPTKIEKNLGLTDFVGSVFNLAGSGCMLVMGAFRLENGFIGVPTIDTTFTYNPASGYLLSAESEGNTFDTSEALSDSDSYTSSSFKGSALVYGEGDPVIIYNASQNNSIWNLRAVEQYLRDADGNIVHDFSEGTIQLDTSTGEWTLNGTNVVGGER